MYMIVGVALIACGACQVIGAGEDFVYHFKMPEFYARVLTKMEQGVNSRAEEMGRVLEQQCPFAQVPSLYKKVIDMAERSPYRKSCPTIDHKLVLKSVTEKFRATKEECLKKADCKTDLADTTAKVINTIQEFDTQAFKDSWACADDACKLQVQHKMQENLFKLYEDSNPHLRLTADKAMFNTKCHSSMVDCMIKNNNDNMKDMYTGIAKLQTCLSNFGLVIEESKTASRPTWYQ